MLCKIPFALLNVSDASQALFSAQYPGLNLLIPESTEFEAVFDWINSVRTNVMMYIMKRHRNEILGAKFRRLKFPAHLSSYIREIRVTVSIASSDHGCLPTYFLHSS